MLSTLVWECIFPLLKHFHRLNWKSGWIACRNLSTFCCCCCCYTLHAVARFNKTYESKEWFARPYVSWFRSPALAFILNVSADRVWERESVEKKKTKKNNREGEDCMQNRFWFVRQAKINYAMRCEKAVGCFCKDYAQKYWFFFGIARRAGNQSAEFWVSYCQSNGWFNINLNVYGWHRHCWPLEAKWVSYVCSMIYIDAPISRLCSMWHVLGNGQRILFYSLSSSTYPSSMYGLWWHHAVELVEKYWCAFKKKKK